MNQHKKSAVQSKRESNKLEKRKINRNNPMNKVRDKKSEKDSKTRTSLAGNSISNIVAQDNKTVGDNKNNIDDSLWQGLNNDIDKISPEIRSKSTIKKNKQIRKNNSIKLKQMKSRKTNNNTWEQSEVKQKKTRLPKKISKGPELNSEDVVGISYNNYQNNITQGLGYVMNAGVDEPTLSSSISKPLTEKERSSIKKKSRVYNTQKSKHRDVILSSTTNRPLQNEDT